MASSGHDLVPRELKFLALTLEDSQLDVDALLLGPIDCHVDALERGELRFSVTTPAVDPPRVSGRWQSERIGRQRESRNIGCVCTEKPHFLQLWLIGDTSRRAQRTVAAPRVSHSSRSSRGSLVAVDERRAPSPTAIAA